MTAINTRHWATALQVRRPIQGLRGQGLRAKGFPPYLEATGPIIRNPQIPKTFRAPEASEAGRRPNAPPPSFGFGWGAPNSGVQGVGVSGLSLLGGLSLGLGLGILGSRVMHSSMSHGIAWQPDEVAVTEVRSCRALSRRGYILVLYTKFCVILLCRLCKLLFFCVCGVLRVLHYF